MARCYLGNPLIRRACVRSLAPELDRLAHVTSPAFARTITQMRRGLVCLLVSTLSSLAAAQPPATDPLPWTLAFDVGFHHSDQLLDNDAPKANGVSVGVEAGKFLTPKIALVGFARLQHYRDTVRDPSVITTHDVGIDDVFYGARVHVFVLPQLFFGASLGLVEERSNYDGHVTYFGGSFAGLHAGALFYRVDHLSFEAITDIGRFSFSDGSGDVLWAGFSVGVRRQ
jgi:hypothetical protein